MKRFSFKTIMMVLAAMLLGFALNVKADTILPSTFVTHSDDRSRIAYIAYDTTEGKREDYGIVGKKTSDGTFVYCLDLNKKYDGNKTYTKTKELSVGINYIIKNRPHTNDNLRDFYITQMAVYMYQDYINGNFNNLSKEITSLIILGGTKADNNLVDAKTKAATKDIYNLYAGAVNYKKNYVEKNGYINITTTSVTFTEKDGYFTSSKIYLKSGNLNGDITKTLVNATPNTKVYRDTADNGYVIKIPVTDIPEGKKVTFTLKFSGAYKQEKAYYYYTSDSHQRLVYDKLEVINKPVEASISLTVKNFKDTHKVKISKTDITQTKEIEGATLVLKDENGKEIDKWVSTTTSHVVTLYEGEYSLTETIAPKGYKISTTTIYFKVDSEGKIYEKVDGKYKAVNKINMINELKDVVRISKTDVTQSKEIEGATLVLKDANGKEIDKWVSTTTSHNVVLDPGEYSLTETIAPKGYKLSTTTITFKIDAEGKIYEKVKGKWVTVDKINMINELVDVTSIVKKDSTNDNYVAGATLVIKDAKGNVVQQFVSTNSVYQITLAAGEYTLEEVAAPEGYLTSNEKLFFRILDNGSLQVKNSNGVYEDSVMIVFYNTPEDHHDVPVPPTGKTTLFITLAGITLLISGVAYVIKTTKEC